MGSTLIEPSERRQMAECKIEIEKSSLHRVALEDATNDATTSAARIGELLSRSEDTKKYISQVLSLYLVALFGLTLWVVLSNTLHKSNVWSPLVLTAMAAGLCFILVWQYGMAIARLRGDMHDEENNLKAAEEVRNGIRQFGVHYMFYSIERYLKKRSTCYHFIPYALILLFFTFFTILLLLSHWGILCSEQ